VVATLVEDFFTAGTGFVDDAPSFVAASAAVARGLQMIRGLPTASAAAAVTLSVHLEASSGAGPQVQAVR
jgi:hypothetical protein